MVMTICFAMPRARSMLLSFCRIYGIITLQRTHQSSVKLTRIWQLLDFLNFCLLTSLLFKPDICLMLCSIGQSTLVLHAQRHKSLVYSNVYFIFTFTLYLFPYCYIWCLCSSISMLSTRSSMFAYDYCFCV